MSDAASSSPRPPSPAEDPARHVFPPLRKDLVEVRQKYLGRTYVVLKNPISLAYFRLQEAHYEAAQLFDGQTSSQQLVEQLAQTSRYWRALPQKQALQELTALGRQLSMGGLLRIRGGSAVARGEHLKKLKKSRWLELGIGQVLYFRKSFVDPDKFLSRITPFFRPLFTRTFVVLTGVLFAITLVAVLRQGDQLAHQGANFFTLHNLAISWVIFFGVKIIHEFGHGISCKHFGGEVHEMGFMFILFTPYLFVNVSDSWRATKAARIWVGSAGIFVELIIACLAAWIWLLTQPGLLHQLAFNTMFLASVSTVLFNANPLLKFDGYYIMTDLLETPNLKQKSNAYITWWAQKYLLGMHRTPLRLATWELSPLFGIYAVLSYLYGWFILYNIAHLIFNILEPVGLSFLSRTYVVLFLFTSLALPFYRLMRSVRESPDFNPAVRPRLRRVAWAALLLLGLLFLLPWQDTIKRSAVLEHGKVELVTSKTPGFLQEVYVQSGQVVRKGDLLGRLENFALGSELRELELELEGLEVRYRAAFTDPDPNIRNSAAAIKKLQEELREQIAARREYLAALEVRAPADGIIRIPRPRELEGQYFPAGKPIFEIGYTGPLRVIIALNEREARRVHAGQPAQIRFASLPGFKLEGQVAAEPVAGLEEFSSPLLANLAGGDVPAEVVHGERLVPSTPHYEAEVFVQAPQDSLPAGLLGRARIDAGRTTLGTWLYQRVLDQIDPSIRL